MQCFARWHEDESGLCFRDQTILQFGKSWNLLANFILLNPGSALPLNRTSQDEFLESKDLPFYVSKHGAKYHRFSIDRLMTDLLKLYSSKYNGGVLKLYNLFNLKNQNSGNAIEQYKKNKSDPNIHTDINEIKYCTFHVIVATGSNLFSDPGLVDELKKFISLAEEGQLFSLTKVKDKIFTIAKANPNKDGIIESYHPSYTFKYGNTTQFT